MMFSLCLDISFRYALTPAQGNVAAYVQKALAGMWQSNMDRAFGKLRLFILERVLQLSAAVGSQPFVCL